MINKKTLLFIIVCLISTSIFSQGTYVVNRRGVKCGAAVEIWPQNAKWLFKDFSGQYCGSPRKPKKRSYQRCYSWKRPRKR